MSFIDRSNSFLGVYIHVCGSVTLRNVNEMRNAISVRNTRCEMRKHACFQVHAPPTFMNPQYAIVEEEDRVRRLATLRKGS